MGEITMPAGTNESISYSEALCCKYLFSVDNLRTIQNAALLGVNFTFYRWAEYGMDLIVKIFTATADIYIRKITRF